jgi:hypothetical protein
MKSRLIYFLIFSFYTISSGFSQQVQKTFTNYVIDSASYNDLLQNYGRCKNLPSGYEKQTLLALSFFPELKDVKINFKLKKQTSPLMVMPTLGSTIFRSPKKRTYIVFISTSSKMDSVIIKNLPYDAQIGVLGHELSHVSFFIGQGRFGMFRVVLGNISRKYLDKIEFETDRSTIDHGLGWQLLSWSEYVREKLKMKKWKDIDEYIYGKSRRPKGRYMNPETIKAVMDMNPLYNK